MTMDLERTDSRHWHFALGPVERWVVAAVAAASVAAAYWFASSVTARLDEQARALSMLTTQQAVANAQLLTLNGQLTDIPQMRSKMAEHEVQINALQESQRELRQMRGLR